MIVSAYKSFDGKDSAVTISEIDQEGRVIRRIGQKLGDTGWLLVQQALEEAGLPPALFVNCDWRGCRVEHRAAV